VNRIAWALPATSAVFLALLGVAGIMDTFEDVQPFSQKSRTPTVAKEFPIGLCGVCGVVRPI